MLLAKLRQLCPGYSELSDEVREFCLCLVCRITSAYAVPTVPTEGAFVSLCLDKLRNLCQADKGSGGLKAQCWPGSSGHTKIVVV